jgi:hypothetical protein
MKNVDVKSQRDVQSLYEKFGPVPACIVCGHDNPYGLTLHCVAGPKYGQQTAPVCRKCLPELKERQQSHPEPRSTSPSEAERSAQHMLGQADILEAKAQRIRRAAWVLFDLDRRSAVKIPHTFC